MRPPPVRAAPLPGTTGPIAPRHVWTRLTPSQQQQVRQALIVVGQHLLAHLIEKPPREETSHECHH